MSLRHGLLGLLAEEPASGYDLTRSFEERLGSWAWHTSHSHIYPELRRMSEDGLVEVVEVQSRGRKTYAVTADGLAELRRWLRDPPEQELVRSGAALRLFLIGNLEPDEARVMLQAYIDNADRQLERLRAQMAAAPPEWTANPLAVGRMAAERGLHTLPAVREWAQWCIAQLDTQTRATSS